MTIRGRLTVKNDTEQKTTRFQKRTFVASDHSPVQQHYTLQLTQQRCKLLDAFNVGDEMTIECNLLGKSWENPERGIQYFNVLEVSSITR